MFRTCGTTVEYFRRMLKKAVQQGRSERRGEEVHTALRVGRSPLQWVLANGKAPTAFPTSEKLLLNVEPLSEARTLHGKWRVSARRGRAGEKSDFFSILLKHEFDADSPQMNIGMVCPVDGGVKIPGNRPRLIEPFLKGHIQPNRLRPERRGSSARHHSQKPALAFTQESS